MDYLWALNNSLNKYALYLSLEDYGYYIAKERSLQSPLITNSSLPSAEKTNFWSTEFGQKILSTVERESNENILICVPESPIVATKEESGVIAID